MGTSRTFISIQNKGLSQVELQTKVRDYPAHFGERADGGAILWCSETAKWLPFYNAALCERVILFSRQLNGLSQFFEAPVLAFTVVDSDVLLVLFCDAAQNISSEYAKTIAGEEDEMFSGDFPDFILSLCNEEDQEKLRAAWDAEDEIFADSCMATIAGLLGISLIYDEEMELPEYQKLSNVTT